MRIHTYKEKAGRVDILIEPKVGRGLSPVLLRGVEPGSVRGQVRSVLAAMAEGELPAPARSTA